MLCTYSSENSSSELAVIKSAGYDEVFSSVLLDAIANWKVKRFSSIATSAPPACLTYMINTHVCLYYKLVYNISIYVAILYIWISVSINFVLNNVP